MQISCSFYCCRIFVLDFGDVSPDTETQEEINQLPTKCSCEETVPFKDLPVG